MKPDCGFMNEPAFPLSKAAAPEPVAVGFAELPEPDPVDPELASASEPEPDPVDAELASASEPEPVAVADDPDVPVAVDLWLDAVVVTDADPVLELWEADEVKEIVTDSEARQVEENTLCADLTSSPWHFSVIFPANAGSRDPHSAFRSAGLG